MKKLHFIISIVIVFSISFILSSCTSEKEDAGSVEEGGLVLVLNLESDSDNGIEWVFEQDDSLFKCVKAFLEEEDENGEINTEIQTFTLKPINEGNTNIRFVNSSDGTTYTYECKVDESIDNIIVDSSKGESSGKEVDAPEIIVERN